MNTPQKQDTPKPQEPQATKPAMVRVRVLQTINIDGLVIRPNIDSSGRLKGQTPIVKAVEAIIPKALATAYGDKYVTILSDAAANAKIGLVAS